MKQKFGLVLAVAFCALCLLCACGESGGSGDTPLTDGDTNDSVEQEESRELESADKDDEATESERVDADTEESVEQEAADGDNGEELENDTTETTESEAETESEDNVCGCTPYTGTYCVDAGISKASVSICTLLEAGVFSKVKIDELSIGCGLRVAAMLGANELEHQDITGEKCPALFDGEPQAANECRLFYSDDQSQVTVICMDRNASATCERLFSKEACPEVHCVNNEMDQGESDTDCGGDCKPCELNGLCKRPQDCESGDCYGGRCVEPRCPDGHTSGQETCDDDNSESGDGCDKDCQVEQGFYCEGTPSICEAVCGDGMVIEGHEDCDDGGTEPGDGCDYDCHVEPGYTCKGSPSVCRPTCSQTADCVQPTKPCVEARCVEGGCEIVLSAAGSLAPQKSGDCLRAECDGQGNILQMIDDADPQKSDTLCRSYSCSNGKNVPINAQHDTPCSDNGGQVCDGSGTCVACTKDSDCPATGNACRKASCDLYACGAVNEAYGTLSDQQTTGDCLRNICDGGGNILTIVDAQDTPPADGPCRTGVCNQSVPGQINKAPGDQCGDGLACDGNGNCVGCVNAGDCPGVDNDCKSRTCNAGACGMSFTASGTAIISQIRGDCHTLQCNGFGGALNVVDNGDTPLDDGNACTTETCQDGTPTFPPKAAGAPCSQNGGVMCDGAGACVQCMLGPDCKSGVCESHVCQAPTCTDGFANGDETGLDCGGGCPNACPKLAMAISGSSDGVWGAVYDSQGSWQLAKLASATGYAQVAMEVGGRATLVSRDSASNILSYSNYDPKTTLFSPLLPVGSGVTAQNISLEPSAVGTSMLFHGLDYKLYFATENLTGLWSPLAEPVGIPQQFGPSGGTLVSQGMDFDAFFIADGTNKVTSISRVGGNWQAAFSISADSPNIWLQPAIASLSGSTELLVVWVNSVSNALTYSTRTGGVWSLKATISNATSVNRPALVTLVNDSALIVYRGEDGYLYHSVFSTGAWSAPAALRTPNVSADGTPGLANANSAPEADLAYTSGGSVYHMRYVGGTWSAPSLVKSGSFSQVVLSSRR